MSIRHRWKIYWSWEDETRWQATLFMLLAIAVGGGFFISPAFLIEPPNEPFPSPWGDLLLIGWIVLACVVGLLFYLGESMFLWIASGMPKAKPKLQHSRGRMCD